MKLYRYAPHERQVVIEVDDHAIDMLNPRLDLANHSPDGFACGYGGSGPSQLALALCADALGSDQRALTVYHEVRWALIANLPQADPWVISDTVVVSICANLERRLDLRRRREG